MDILATSTYLRYLELTGQTLVFPKMPIKATMLKKSHKALLIKMAMHVRPVADIYNDVPEDVQYAEELDAEGNKVILSGDKEKTH